MRASEYFNSSGATVVPATEGERYITAEPAAGGFVASVTRTIRYRFFIIAGIFPYVLGWAAASHATGEMNWLLGILGLGGVVFLSLGIEGMNEYFDSRIGGDRVFSSVRRIHVWWHLPLGLGGLVAAVAVALCLATMRGWGVIVFALCGGTIALSYLMPPIRLSHRGLGEAVIAVGYGPGLTLGGFYLQTGRLSWEAVLLSLVPGVAMFAMALANEVPDYHGDRLVGKKNLIVRVGPRRGVILYGATMALWFGLITLGVLLGIFPWGFGLCLLLIPAVFRSMHHGLKHCEIPRLYVGVIRTTILTFVIANIIAIMSYGFPWNVS